MLRKSTAPPTHEFIHAKAIDHDTLFLKNGGLRKIILVSGMNFELQSQQDQEITTYGYQALLNSLDFPIQIFIYSRKVNIAPYLDMLRDQVDNATNQRMRTILEDHRTFIQGLVEENDIVQKSFFVVVPYDPIQIPGSGGFLGKLFGMKKRAERLASPEDMKRITERVDQIIEGLNRVGLRAAILTTDELLELFYNLYNPTVTETGVELKTGTEKTA